MSLFVIVGIAFGLAMDAFAVALASSTRLMRVSPRQVFRLSFHFGLFQALMPILGWFIARTALEYVEAYDHWVVFVLLGFIGTRAILGALAEAEAVQSEDAMEHAADPTKGLTLVALSVATSIDAMAAGATFAVVGVAIHGPVLIIGAITAALTAAGMMWGSRLGARFGKPVEVLGGLILIAMGAKPVLDHFFLA